MHVITIKCILFMTGKKIKYQRNIDLLIFGPKCKGRRSVVDLVQQPVSHSIQPVALAGKQIGLRSQGLPQMLPSSTGTLRFAAYVYACAF